VPEAYELHEGRFLQELSVAAGVGGLTCALGPVPRGKIWTIIFGFLSPSVAETKTVWYQVSNVSNSFPVTVPMSIALSLAMVYPLLTNGMELKLYQGQILRGYRDSATAGSNFYMGILYVETDLPYYSYDEPLKKIVKQAQAHGSVYRSSGGVSIGGGMPGGGHGGEGGGGGGGAEPY